MTLIRNGRTICIRLIIRACVIVIHLALRKSAGGFEMLLLLIESRRPNINRPDFLERRESGCSRRKYVRMRLERFSMTSSRGKFEYLVLSFCA